VLTLGAVNQSARERAKRAVCLANRLGQACESAQSEDKVDPFPHLSHLHVDLSSGS
jgi:hypothetical protein